MIHTVTPNPAWDVTYRLAELVTHGVNRVEGIVERPGGKGVNVARLASSAGTRATVHGFLGGSTGARLSDDLAERAPQIVQRWTQVGDETRRTIAVVDPDDTTMLNEPGARVSEEDWARLTQTLLDSLSRGDVVTLSGSLPAGSSPKDVAGLVRAARDAGAVVVVDTSGQALLAAAEAGADLLKPNRDELVQALAVEDLDHGVSALLDRGAGAVLTSLGADGMRLDAKTPSRRRWRARLDAPVQGNPTGAGDAVVAALACALSRDPAGVASRDQRLAILAAALTDAVTWSAAAVLAPVAGEMDRDAALRLRAHTIIEEI